MRRAIKPLLFILCLVPLALTTWDVLQNNIRGDWVKEITHRTGWWGLVFITITLAVTPLRRITGINQLQPYRRMLGLFGFTYILVHFLIYVILDKQVPFDPSFALKEIVKDIAKRPYITVGFAAFVMLIPLAVTSTKGWIKRLGKNWTRLHALIYVIAMLGVIHFMWSVKADRTRPVTIGAIIIALLALRLISVQTWKRMREGQKSVLRAETSSL